MQEYRTNTFAELCKSGRDTHLTREEQSALEVVFSTVSGVAINKIIDRLGLSALDNALSRDNKNTDYHKGEIEVLRRLRVEINAEINKYKKQKKK